jgi:CheY-like chemotaxis protein
MAEALIIDDNRTTADALGQMLNVLGFKARLAYGSGAAMSILGSGLTPKFICLDINMPGLNGVEILAYLRREPRLMPVPVIVITSDDQPEAQEGHEAWCKCVDHQACYDRCAGGSEKGQASPVKPFLHRFFFSRHGSSGGSPFNENWDIKGV